LLLPGRRLHAAGDEIDRAVRIVVGIDVVVGVARDRLGARHGAAERADRVADDDPPSMADHRRSRRPAGGQLPRAGRPRVVRQLVRRIAVVRRARVQSGAVRRPAVQLQLQAVGVDGRRLRRESLRRDGRRGRRVHVTRRRLSFSSGARRGVLSSRRMAFIATVLTLLPLAAPSPTRFVTSKDGTRIAYDVTGAGPALILLHGGGGNRHDWHEAGYVARLSSAFTVIAIDQRGSGESDKPLTASAYAIDTLVDDVL